MTTEKRETFADLIEQEAIIKAQMAEVETTISELGDEIYELDDQFDKAVLANDDKTARALNKQKTDLIAKRGAYERRRNELEGRLLELQVPARRDNARLNDLLMSMKKSAKPYDGLMDRLNEHLLILIDLAREASKVGGGIQNSLSQHREVLQRLAQGGVAAKTFQSFGDLGFKYNPLDGGRIRDGVLDRLEKAFRSENYRFQKIGR